MTLWAWLGGGLLVEAGTPPCLIAEGLSTSLALRSRGWLVGYVDVQGPSTAPGFGREEGVLS